MPVRCQLGLPLLLLRQMEVSMSTATHEAVRTRPDGKITLRLDAETLERLERAALEDRRKVSSLARLLLIDGLEEWDRATQGGDREEAAA